MLGCRTLVHNVHKMEKIQFDYSTKNIPIPNRNTFKIGLLDKVESLIKRMRWKAYFFLNPSTDKNRSQFDLKSRKCPPPIDELKPFEDDLFHMVETIKFRKTTNSNKENLKRDVNKIQSSTKIFVPADKTRNYYELDKDHHDKLLRENITKNYRKANADSANQVNQELKKITTKHDISEKVEIMAHRQAFITLKDLKESFKNNPTCRLINPAKSNLGRVSKSIVDKINQKIRTATSANQWRNTQAVIEWFCRKSTTKKNTHSSCLIS